ncbi:GntR family transcriptional regulator [Paenarthrobacter ilicis]|uniref:GntR family transcriptional regulator n=1 Tax=Paenarthrobacter ilicis TaxID=43665 RepID=UPI0028D5B4D1|nr:GntR family transcriptional regulator [Paenarthrobacter ilicis]
MAAQNRRGSKTTSSLGFRTIQEQVFEMLHEWILDGSLKPGLRLQMRDLASGFEMSTIPIREALRRLEGTGLVTQEPHRGYKVADLAVADLHDYYNVRAILEVEAVRQGATVIDDKGLQELRRILADLNAAVEDNDIPAVLAFDEDFIAVILAAVQNAALSDLVHGLWDRVQPYKLLFTSIEHGLGAHFVIEDNRELLAACEARDGSRAAEVLKASLQKAHMRLTALLELHEEKTEPTVAETPDESLAALCKRLIAARANS